ncbi:MAG TPA: NAD(P)-dependent alcohol dehydrogenase [Longimicrobiales bacterium]|nr:NAD(P)-dependent alcohol dehydrogenase [Longimicrobiales bacterium]
MRAAVLTEFGPPDVLKLREVAKPRPGDGDVLIRVHATSVNFGDTLARNLAAISPRRFHMPLLFWILARISFGIRRPRIRILGSEFAGQVEAAGRAVTRFRKGDPVFGFRGPRMGAYAEYLCMPEDGVLATKPRNMTYEQAAAVPYGAVMALGLLRRAQVGPGTKVLVVGASGGIGTAVLQLARYHFGAEVAGVCGTARLEYIKSLGAHPAIDYTQEDFVDRAESYDVIIDILGKTSFRRCRRVLKPGGRLIFVSFKTKQILQALWTAVVGDKKAICALVTEKPEDLALVRTLVEAGKLTPVVDRSYPLGQADEAHRYAESGARTGSVVIAVSPAATSR